MRRKLDETPEFDPEQRYWVRRCDLWPLLFDEETSFDKWCRKIGDRFKHTERSGPNRGAWIYAPGWLRAWAAATAPDAPNDSNLLADRLKRAQAEKAELELERLRGELIPAAEWEQDVLRIGRGIRQGIELLGAISTDAQRVMLDALDEVECEFMSETNGSNGKA